MRYIKQALRGGTSSSGSLNISPVYGIGDEGEASRADSVCADGSPGCINMIPTEGGALTKRGGFRVSELHRADSVHYYSDYNGDILFYLDGSSISWDGQSHDVGFSLEGYRSLQWDTFMIFYGGRGLIIVDVKYGGICYWNGVTVGGDIHKIYVPTIYIGCTPDGSGAPYETVNLLSERVAEQFIGDGSSKDFYVHLDGDDFEAYIKQADGSWKATAIDTFGHRVVGLVNAPPAPSVSGEDNVRIVYKMLGNNTNSQKIAGCTCAVAFGVGGHRDRIFMSGNTGCPGKVFYSHIDNPLYFGDLDYIKVGDNETDVYALMRSGDSLAVVADDSIYSVKGTEGISAAVTHDALFAITAIYPTPRPAGSVSSCIFMDEPVYLTREGVFAITPSGVLDERCADARSERINPHLTKENTADMDMVVWGNYLVISNKKGRLYLLDGTSYTARGNSRRYEGYIWQDVVAKSMWVKDGVLCFNDGEKNCRFCDNGDSDGLCDEREQGVFYPIKCYWESPMLYPADFKDFKFFTRAGTLCRAIKDSDGGDMNGDMRIIAYFDGDKPRTVCDYSGALAIFRYRNIDYGSFCYRSRVKSYSLSRPLLHKRGKGLKLRFENDKLRRAMTVVGYSADYIKM